jgi:four helix bundle protein
MPLSEFKEVRVRDYTKIEAWKLADDLAVSVYGVTRSLPEDERYGLSSQMRRAAVSVAANIVEGATRGSKRDYLHFLYIARASLCETRYLLHLIHRLGYASSTAYEDLAEQSQAAILCLAGLIRAVEPEAGVSHSRSQTTDHRPSSPKV